MFECFINTKPTTEKKPTEKKPTEKKIKKIIKEVASIKKRKKMDNKDEFAVIIRFFFMEHNKNHKIDLDNLAKPVLDAMCGIIYYDDSQIYKLTLTKEINTILEGTQISVSYLKK